MTLVEAQRNPYSDFLRPPRDAVTNHAIKTNDCEQEGKATKQSSEGCNQAFANKRRIDVIFQRLLCDDDVSYNGPHFRADSCCDRFRIEFGADNKLCWYRRIRRQSPLLEKVVVHRWLHLLADVFVFRVTGQTDNLHPVAALDDGSPDW